MSAYSSPTGPSDRKPPSFGIGSFLFAIIFTLMVYLLISSMMRHHFFKGGHPSRSTTSSIQTLNHTRLDDTAKRFQSIRGQSTP
jgi:hypothetical protein